MEEFKGKIKFYDDQVDVIFPIDFNKFAKNLEEILGLSDDFLNNIKISYKDEDGDKIQIKSADDYKLFIDEIQKKKISMELLIEVKEESNILIKKCSSSILAYVAKNSSANINNLSEEIKENNKSLELSDEINPNNIQNEKDENEKNKIISEEEKKLNNDNINNNENKIDNNVAINNPINEIKNENEKDQKENQVILDNNINKNLNNNNINNDNINNNNINNINNNNINNINNNSINNINNINNIKNNNINNLNNNINNINNINNLNNNNINNNIQNPQIKNAQAQLQNPQNLRPQLQNQNQNHAFLYILSFPFSCSICRRGPIYRSLYFCQDCNIIICPQCELKEGPVHLHPLFKAQNSAQFEALNINGISSIEKFMDGVGNKLGDAYKSFVGFFGGGGNNDNNNNNSNNNNQNRNNVQIIKGPQWVSLVQIARSSYDLRTVTDKQIEQALIKSKGNIDEAVISLTM